MSEGGSGGSGSSSGSFVGDADSCQPGSVTTYQPGAYRPASGKWQGLCVADAEGDPIARFYDQCLGPDANSDQCNSFRTTNTSCVGCILTSETAMKYGPILDHGGFVTANVAGCLELASDQSDASELASELSCAKAVQGLAGCELAACEANCAVNDAASLAEYDTCATEAETGGCASYAAAASCVESASDASAVGAACLSDFQTFYQVVVPYFCGPAPASDGGAPPEPDGAAVDASPHDGASE